MIARLTGYVVLIAAGVFVLYAILRNDPRSQVSLIFSPTQVLEATWLRYKQNYLEPETFRTLDRQRNNVTTSEGQAYTMLRAVWMGDKTTFDGAWQWTQHSLARPHDHLFAWLWGQHNSGEYGVLTEQNGENSASDADTDIAMSLIFAYARWQDRAYLDAARNIVQDIWNHEVVYVGGAPYLAADNREVENLHSAVINPSYFNPAAYKLFALIDPIHPWAQLASTSYVLIGKSMSPLPPDWVRINETTGELLSAASTTSSYDAMRIPFRLALDWEWFHDARDTTLLARFSPLLDDWHERNRIAAVYTQSGEVIDGTENVARYGTTIGSFVVMDPSAANAVYTHKLLSLYDPGASAWGQLLSYYDDNWAWFGVALYNHLLPNLAAHVPSRAFAL